MAARLTASVAALIMIGLGIATLLPRSPAAAHASYLDTCTMIGQAKRDARPDRDYGAGTTARSACACEVNRMIAAGVTVAEIGVLDAVMRPMAERAAATHAGGAEEREAMRRMQLQASIEIMMRLGQERANAVLDVLTDGLSCPGSRAR